AAPLDLGPIIELIPHGHLSICDCPRERGRFLRADHAMQGRARGIRICPADRGARMLPERHPADAVPHCSRAVRVWRPLLDRIRQHRAPRCRRPPREAGAHSARHSLHDQRDRGVRRVERDLKTAGSALSGRRGAVRAQHRRHRAGRRLRAAAVRPRRVRDQQAALAFRAQRLAVLLADLHSARLQHAAARRRGRDQFLGAAVRHAGRGVHVPRSGRAGWLALLVGFLGVLLVTHPGVGTFQVGSLFALGNAILYGSVTVGVRRMTATESTETLTLYQLLFLTVFFGLSLPFWFVVPTWNDAGIMALNGAANAVGQYWWTRSL